MLSSVYAQLQLLPGNVLTSYNNQSISLKLQFCVFLMQFCENELTMFLIKEREKKSFEEICEQLDTLLFYKAEGILTKAYTSENLLTDSSFLYNRALSKPFFQNSSAFNNVFTHFIRKKSNKATKIIYTKKMICQETLKAGNEKQSINIYLQSS